MLVRSHVLAMAMIALSSCGGDNEKVADVSNQAELESAARQSAQLEEIAKRGREAVTALRENLFNAQLKSAIESGGAASALQICQTAAKPITDGTAQQFEGITLQRTALKLRNPANKPDGLDLEVLTAFATRHDAGMDVPKEMVELTEDGARYYKPIFVKKICLNCHGSRDDMDPSVVKGLALLYPEDQAHGYKEGDFRGLMRADIETSEGRDSSKEGSPRSKL